MNDTNNQTKIRNIKTEKRNQIIMEFFSSCSQLNKSKIDERIIDRISMRMYTSEQVHEIVEQVLLALDGTAAALEAERTHLDNDISQNTSPDDTKVTLTVAEAAQMVRISKPKMYEILRYGKVRSVKVGKKILVSRQSLLNWIKEGDSTNEKAC